MNVYGLIGYPLSHSFSRKYFTEKFQKENIKDSIFLNFEIPSIESFPEILKEHGSSLKGMNVTIPYKQQIIPYLNSLDHSAQFVGAVNVIKVQKDLLIGFNSDYYGFMESLKRFLPENSEEVQALILGTGGAAKAVEGALKTLKIPYSYVSRESKEGVFTYEEIDSEKLGQYQLIINASPLGMFPKIDTCPTLPYEALTKYHFLFDIVYNPETTLFMQKGLEKGAKVKNGLEMLHLQAEKAWEIWNS